MTRIETSRVNEVIGLHIGTVQEAAHKLNAGSDLQELKSEISDLEKTIAELKESLASLPYKH
jgi:polyhydroxyalkanoate synthesis regulator phasin